jgi:hypothetical protein
LRSAIAPPPPCKPQRSRDCAVLGSPTCSRTAGSVARARRHPVRPRLRQPPARSFRSRRQDRCRLTCLARRWQRCCRRWRRLWCRCCPGRFRPGRHRGLRPRSVLWSPHSLRLCPYLSCPILHLCRTRCRRDPRRRRGPHPPQVLRRQHPHLETNRLKKSPETNRLQKAAVPNDMAM